MGRNTEDLEESDFFLGKYCDLKLALLSPERMEIVREYCKLRLLPDLSEEQANRIAEILELADTDRIVDFLITEADHSLGHYLGLLDEASRHSYKNQQALLREYLGTPNLCKEQSREHGDSQPDFVQGKSALGR